MEGLGDGERQGGSRWGSGVGLLQARNILPAAGTGTDSWVRGENLRSFGYIIKVLRRKW